MVTVLQRTSRWDMDGGPCFILEPQLGEMEAISGSLELLLGSVGS